MKKSLKVLMSAEPTVFKLAMGLVFVLGLSACGGGGTSYSAPDPTSKAAKVSSFWPATAMAGVATPYQVNGVNLPSTVVVTLAEGSCATPTNVTDTSFSVVCTAGGAGAKAMIALTAQADVEPKGWWIGQQSVMVTAAPRVGLLPDTGITPNQCYAAGSNALFSCTSVDAIALNDKQDGMVGRDVNADSTDGWLGASYRPIGAVGDVNCVKDEVTGKTWQRASTTLSAFPGDAMNQQAASIRDAANAGTGLCGYTDWTIPNPSDLQSLVNYGVTNGSAAIDLNWFDVKKEWYFTLTQYLSGSNNVWVVDFTRGQVNGIGASGGSAELRLMRASTPVVTRFTYSSDGAEVNDAQTGLIWQRCTAGQIWNNTTSSCTGGTTLYPHADALAHAKTQNIWRLPNVKELASLVNTATKAPAIDVTAFPNMPSAGVGYWSSTPDAQTPASAWSVEFGLGTVASTARTNSNFVRLVR